MDKTELRKLATRITDQGVAWYKPGILFDLLGAAVLDTDQCEGDAAFIAAASPATILALLDEIEALTPTGLRKLDADTIRALLDEIAAKDAEIERLKGALKKQFAMNGPCKTCLCWPDMPRAAPCHLCVEFSMWQPRQPDRDDDISRVYEEAKAVMRAAAYDPEPMSETCPTCRGNGNISMGNGMYPDCPDCDGTGEKK